MAESFLGIPKPLSDYGKRGKDVASAFSSGSLGYHLEQLSMDDRNLLKRNNNFDFDAFLKREGGNSTVKAIKSILEKTGDNIQKGKIPPAAIIDHLTKVDLKINDKTEPISKELAWGILR